MKNTIKIVCDVCKNEFEGLGLPIEIRYGQQQIYLGFLCENCIKELLQALSKTNPEETTKK